MQYEQKVLKNSDVIFTTKSVWKMEKNKLKLILADKGCWNRQKSHDNEISDRTEKNPNLKH